MSGHVLIHFVNNALIPEDLNVQNYKFVFVTVEVAVRAKC